ncbi:MAG: phosphotransferase, partial [Pseudomonadota bacterium]
GLAQGSVDLWEASSGGRAELINVSENVTYLIHAPNGTKSVLRVHRARYHSRRAIECELAWLDALREGQVIAVPRPLTAKSGARIEEAHASELEAPRFLVLFEYIEGAEPDAGGDLVPLFHTLGEMAAKCHVHTLAWDRPEPFERLTWDTDAVFGARPIWGDWREAPEVTAPISGVLERVEEKVIARLTAYGRGRDRFGLIHADMRLANILTAQDRPWLIDFDDCGFGWLMYDFAAAISFIEDDPRIPALKAAWLAGYQTQRPLSPADLAEIDTLIMLRRMALLAWIGSHIEAPEPQVLAPGFARTTAHLGQAWLESLP